VLRGAVERVSAIAMTATAVAFALLPLVLAGPSAGFEIVHPMAVVIFGGVITSTFLNLFVVPALYFRFGSSPEPEAAAVATVLLRSARALARRGRAPQEIPVRLDAASPGEPLPGYQTTRE
jgi:hypothetical protein